MVAVTTRAGKGSPLTNAEIDANWNALVADLNTKMTQAQARAAISVSGSLTYNSTTGVLGFTETPLTSANIVSALGFTPLSNAGGTLSGGLTVNGALTQQGNQVLHAGNYNSYSPTLTGTGASGSWGISITGDANTVDGYHASSFLRSVNGVGPDGSGNVTVNVDLSSRIARSGDGMTGMLATKSNTAGSYLNANDNAFSVRGDGSNAAVMSFHRAGAYAINMGLDTDNWFKIGGWSDGGTRFQVRADGHIHTPAYGWLYDFFFSSVANCGAGYGMGNVLVSNCGNIAGARHELVDNGSQLRLQTSQWNYNCNCTCK